MRKLTHRTAYGATETNSFKVTITNIATGVHQQVVVLIRSTGTAEIIDFLTWKWQKEKSYHLRKELFCVGGDHDEKIAVQFFYEYQDSHDNMKWKRCYGLEDWTFTAEGKMRKRMMSGNDVLLGRDGDGVGVPEEGIEGRWFVDGVDVEDESVTAMLTEKHY